VRIRHFTTGLQLHIILGRCLLSLWFSVALRAVLLCFLSSLCLTIIWGQRFSVPRGVIASISNLRIFTYIIDSLIRLLYRSITQPQGFVHSQRLIFAYYYFSFLTMAFVRGQRRTRCTRYCRCDEMTPQMQTELVTWDPYYWAWYHRRTPKPQGLLFKLPREYTLRITRRLSPARGGGFPVNSLFELAFKTAAILCENFVRKTFSPNPGLLNWHYRQHLLTEASLRCDYGLPPRFACSLLPQLNTRTDDPDDYPFTIHLNVTEEHTEQNFEQFMRLRC